MLLLQTAILLLLTSTVPAPVEITSNQPEQVDVQEEKTESGRELLYRWLKASQELNGSVVNFRRFSYDDAIQFERRGEGKISIANNFRWRIDISPDQQIIRMLDELKDGEILSHKLGDVRYEVASESSSTCMRKNGNLHRWKNEGSRVIPDSYSQVSIARSIFEFEPAIFVIPTMLRMFIESSNRFPLEEQRNKFWQTCRFELGEKHGEIAHLVIRNDSSTVIRRIDILLDRKTWFPDAVKILEAEGAKSTTYVFEKRIRLRFPNSRTFEEPEIAKKLQAEKEWKVLTSTLEGSAKSILENSAEFEAAQIRDALILATKLFL